MKCHACGKELSDKKAVNQHYMREHPEIYNPPGPKVDGEINNDMRNWISRMEEYGMIQPERRNHRVSHLKQDF